MDSQQPALDATGKLDDLINLTKSGKITSLQSRLYRKWVKQASYSNATDDLVIETDKYLF